jgi:hypothetical protein
VDKKAVRFPFLARASSMARTKTTVRQVHAGQQVRVVAMTARPPPRVKRKTNPAAPVKSKEKPLFPPVSPEAKLEIFEASKLSKRPSKVLPKQPQLFLVQEDGTILLRLTTGKTVVGKKVCV